MPANEFEKQVQHRMDEFQLNPSASVWERVEEELRDKRKRKGIFFILLPALVVLLGFFMYYFLDSAKKKELVANDHLATKETSTTKLQSPADEINAPANTKNETGASALKEPAQPAEPGKKDVAEPKNTIIANKKLNISYPVTQTRRLNIERPAKRMHVTQNTTLSPVNDKNVPLKDKNTGEINVPVTATKLPTGIAPKNDAKEPAAIDVKNNKQKANAQITSQDSIATKPDSLAAAVVKTSDNKKPKSKKLSKIKWGVDVFAGASFVQSGMFAWEGMNFGAMAYSASSIPAPPPAGQVPPSHVDPGFSFRIGISGEWKISKRSTVSMGLSYAYASNRIKVGAAMDTSMRNPANNNSFQSYTIYRGAKTEDHTNTYHYISLPIEYHHLLSKKIPLQWDLGIAVNYLLATNALIYSPSYGGIYYEDKDAFFKTHCTLGTGFSFRLKSKKGKEWTAGPLVSFDLTRLLKDDSNKQYLVFTGVNTKLYFSKKTKK